MHVILASNCGTLELLWNLGSLVISGMVKQLLVGANLINVDFSLREDRALLGLYAITVLTA